MNYFTLIYIFVLLKEFSSETITKMCGNGIIDENEECDDGNQIDGDGCSSNCNLELRYYCYNISDSLRKCFPKSPVNVELNLLESWNLELLFSKPIQLKDIKILSQSIEIKINEKTNNSIFYWYLKENENYELRNQSFIIVMNFIESMPKSVLTLTFLAPSLIKDIFNETLSSFNYKISLDLPFNIIYNETSLNYIYFMKWCILIIMIIILILLIPLSIIKSLGLFWSLFSSCQMIQLLILINCEYPFQTIEFFKCFFISNFKFSAFFGPYIQENSYYQDENLPKWIKNTNSYGTMFIDNAFYSIIVLLFVMFSYLICHLANLFNFKYLKSFFAKSRSLLTYGGVLRICLITYTQICLATFLQFINFKFMTGSNAINSLLSLISFAYIIIIPIIFVYILNNKNFNPEDESFKIKFGPLVELMQIKAIMKRNFQILYMIRNFLWVMIVVLIGGDTLIEIFLLMTIQLALITIHLLKRPFENRKVDYLHLINEMLLFATFICIAILQGYDYLKDYSLEIQSRIKLGWVMIVLLSLIIFSKLCCMIYEISMNITILIKRTKGIFKKYSDQELDDDDNFIEMGNYTNVNLNMSGRIN